jgi:5-deoxy-glucuronate isomerase
MSEQRRFYYSAGELSTDAFDLEVTPDVAGWTYSSLRIASLGRGGLKTFRSGREEMVVLPLSGSCVVDCDGKTNRLIGRDSVFSAVSDFAYVPIESSFTVSSDLGGRFAIAGARATKRYPFRYCPAENVSVELRGAGQSSRQVVNFCTPETFEADRIIAVEVLTPAGNWSSYPPHKHDEEKENETALEEVYYFEVADGPAAPGFAYQRVYGHPGREIDVLEEVRTGDVVLIPYGWHGPAMAAPGYDLYYLNVMSGGGAERAWRICDDPTHAWVRSTWDDQAIDPRLPLTGAPGGQR